MTDLARIQRPSTAGRESPAGSGRASRAKGQHATPAPPAGGAAWRQLPGEIDWRICRFGALSPVELARIYRARQQVFTIEQQCIYLDADEYDEVSCHFAAWSSEHVLPLAYARLLNPGTKYAEPAMGRVLTTAPARGLGLGRDLVRRVIAHSAQTNPGLAIRISAQERLERFYADFGFSIVSASYLEDGIPHVEMLRPA